MSPKEEHESENWGQLSDEEWNSICAAGRIDPIKREMSRATILSHENAMDCTIFRLSTGENRDDCVELCDAKIVFIGKHQVPEGLNEEELKETYEGINIDLLVDAWLEYLPLTEHLKAKPEPPDIVSVEPGAGIALPYQLVNFVETEDGRRCILLNCIDCSELLGS